LKGVITAIKGLIASTFQMLIWPIGLPTVFCVNKKFLLQPDDFFLQSLSMVIESKGLDSRLGLKHLTRLILQGPFVYLQSPFKIKQ